MEIKKVILLGVLVSWPSLTTGIAAELRPNVLFIICDDLNTHVSTSDYRQIRTPAFETLEIGTPWLTTQPSMKARAAM